MITEVRVKNTAQNLPTIFALCLLLESRQKPDFVFSVQALVCHSNNPKPEHRARIDFNLNSSNDRLAPGLPHFNVLVFLHYWPRLPFHVLQHSAAWPDREDSLHN